MKENMCTDVHPVIVRAFCMRHEVRLIILQTVSSLSPCALCVCAI